MTLQRLYHPTAYDPDTPIASFWQSTVTDDADHEPLAGEVSCDVAIIGAGFTGLSAALHLAGTYGREVRVVDAAWPGKRWP